MNRVLISITVVGFRTHALQYEILYQIKFEAHGTKTNICRQKSSKSATLRSKKPKEWGCYFCLTFQLLS